MLVLRIPFVYGIKTKVKEWLEVCNVFGVAKIGFKREIYVAVKSSTLVNLPSSKIWAKEIL